jgi:hypothetical protein
VKPVRRKKEPKIRKFDPFCYFKDEFKQHHQNISEEDLEVVRFSRFNFLGE